MFHIDRGYGLPMDLFGLDKHDTASIAGGLSLQLILSIGKVNL